MMKNKILILSAILLLSSCAASSTSSITPTSSAEPFSSVSPQVSSIVSSITPSSSIPESSKESSVEQSSISSSEVSSASSSKTSSMVDEVSKAEFLAFYKANEEARTKLYKEADITLKSSGILVYDDTFTLQLDDVGQYFEFDPSQYTGNEFDITSTDPIKLYIMINHNSVEKYIDDVLSATNEAHFFHHTGLTSSTNNLGVKGTADTPEEIKEYISSDTFDFEVQIDNKNYIRSLKIIVEDPVFHTKDTYTATIYPKGTLQ